MLLRAKLKWAIYKTIFDLFVINIKSFLQKEASLSRIISALPASICESWDKKWSSGKYFSYDRNTVQEYLTNSTLLLRDESL